MLELDLSANAIDGLALNWIPDLATVTELSISNGNIAGDVTPYFAAIPHKESLQVLKLANNGLSGTIEGLGDAIHLTDLDLSNNTLSGSLDTLGAIFNATNRARSDAGTIAILLNDNQFTGGVNFLIDNAATLHLEQLDLSNNQLSDTLPPDMSALPIRYFQINGNGFSGPIPILPPSCHDPFDMTTHLDQTCLVSVDLGAQAGAGWDCPAPSSPPGLVARPWVNYVYHTAECTCRTGKFSDSAAIDCVDDKTWSSGRGGCVDYVTTRALHSECAAHGADVACPVACGTCVDAATPRYRYANSLGPSKEEVRAFCADVSAQAVCTGLRLCGDVPDRS